MPAHTLHDSILTALAGSSSQMPVYLAELQSRIVPEVKSAELAAALELMSLNRELQSCNGFKDGKAYVCYWMSGNLPPAWGKPSKAAGAKKPAKARS